MASVHIPGIGDVPRGWALAGGIGGAGAALYLYRRSKQNAANAAATSSGTSASSSAAAPSGAAGGDPYPPDGTTGNPSDPYSTDPSTGETYGDENSGYGGYGADTGYAEQDTGGVPEGYYPSASGNTNPETPQQWADTVESVLGGLGYSQTTVAEAVGDYLAGQELTSSQAQLIRAALAEVPYPGSALPVKVSASKPAAASKPGKITGLRVSPGKTSATVSWDAVTGAKSYTANLGDVPGHGANFAGTSHTFTGLKSKSHYTARVAAINAAGNGPAASVSFTTT